MTMVPPSISRGLIVQKGLVPECKVQLNFVIFIPQCHPYPCRGWRLFVRPCVSIPWVWMRASTRSRGISYSNVMFRSGDNRAVGSWRNAVNEHFVYRKLFATCRTTSLFTVYHIYMAYMVCCHMINLPIFFWAAIFQVHRMIALVQTMYMIPSSNGNVFHVTGHLCG